MQVTTLTSPQEIADVLEQSKILDIVDLGHETRMHVVNWNGQDILLIGNGIDRAFAVYGPGDFDAETGSVHDIARELQS